MSETVHPPSRSPQYAAALAAARAAFADVTLDEATFARHLDGLAAAGATSDDLLVPERAADLYLACACAAGDPRAHSAFDRRYLERVPAYLAHLRPSATLVDETRQALKNRLLGGDGTARIAQYSGRGDLDHFVCVAAIRAALSLLRRERPSAPLPDEPVAAIARRDPELEFVEARYRVEFSAAFREALQELPSRSRTLLRLHYLQRVPVVQIAKAWGAHRTTVTRWLEEACRTTLEATRERLRTRLALSPSECDSLLVAVQSRLDVAIPSLLALASQD